MTQTEKAEAKRKAKNARRKRQREEQKANGGKSKWTEEERKKNVWLDHWKFKPGNPGNPGPRKPQPLTERYKEELEAPCPEKLRLELGLPPGARIADAIARRRVIDAISSSSKDSNAAATEIADRVEGRSVTRMSGPAGEGLFPPTLQVTFVPKRKEG